MKDTATIRSELEAKLKSLYERGGEIESSLSDPGETDCIPSLLAWS